jgi:BirA family biotin operon repressor/biotin-[acetyl-CoA-carboxylase] ligase
MRLERGGRAVDRSLLCARLLERLDEWYSKLKSGQVELLLARWRTLSCLLGERVKARIDECVVAGAVLGIRASGELILKTDSGEELLLSSERATLLL